MSTRLARLRQEMNERGMDAFLVSSLPNVRYLSGFSGSNGLCVVTRREMVLVTDSRYARQSRAEARGCRRIVTSQGLIEAVAADGNLKRVRIVGIEPDHLSYAQYRSLKKFFPGKSFLAMVTW